MQSFDVLPVPAPGKRVCFSDLSQNIVLFGSHIPAAGPHIPSALS